MMVFFGALALVLTERFNWHGVEQHSDADYAGRETVKHGRGWSTGTGISA